MGFRRVILKAFILRVMEDRGYAWLQQDAFYVSLSSVRILTLGANDQLFTDACSIKLPLHGYNRSSQGNSTRDNVTACFSAAFEVSLVKAKTGWS